jgi:hypothetical protein
VRRDGFREVGSVPESTGDRAARRGVGSCPALRPGPDPFVHVQRKVPEAHAGHLGAGVGLPGAFALDDPEEIFQPAGDIPLPVFRFDPDGIPDLVRLLEPGLGWEPHGDRYRL